MARRLITVLLGVFLLLSVSLVSKAEYPSPLGYVNDFARVIDPGTARQIEVLAERLHREQGIEIAVVTMKTTAPEEPSVYRTKLFNHWGIGGTEDSGLLILLSLEESEIWVEVGYGLEGVLPDGLVGQVIDKEMMESFRVRDWSKGLLRGVETFETLLRDEEFRSSYGGQQEENRREVFFVFVVFLLIAVFLSRHSRKNPPKNPGTRVPPVSTFGGPRGGGFGSGKSSGGGFGGFGGGKSGGGGAGRKF